MKKLWLMTNHQIISKTLISQSISIFLKMDLLEIHWSGMIIKLLELEGCWKLWIWLVDWSVIGIVLVPLEKIIPLRLLQVLYSRLSSFSTSILRRIFKWKDLSITLVAHQWKLRSILPKVERLRPTLILPWYQETPKTFQKVCQSQNWISPAYLHNKSARQSWEKSWLLSI